MADVVGRLFISCAIDGRGSDQLRGGLALVRTIRDDDDIRFLDDVLKAANEQSDVSFLEIAIRFRARPDVVQALLNLDFRFRESDRFALWPEGDRPDRDRPDDRPDDRPADRLDQERPADAAARRRWYAEHRHDDFGTEVSFLLFDAGLGRRVLEAHQTDFDVEAFRAWMANKAAEEACRYTEDPMFADLLSDCLGKDPAFEVFIESVRPDVVETEEDRAFWRARMYDALE